jgi:flagellar motor switch protein FliG
VPRPANDGRNITGAAKAAIFMLAIGDAHAGKLLQMMDDDEIRALSQQMAHLGNINSEAVESLLLDFSEHISSAGALVGTFESTERLLSKNLDPDRVKHIRRRSVVLRDARCGISSATSTRPSSPTT